jgi:hypothetical protein
MELSFQLEGQPERTPQKKVTAIAGEDEAKT